jgi:DNA-binding Xre family transcriptional regulator
MKDSQAQVVATAFAKALAVFLRELGLSRVPEATLALAGSGFAAQLCAAPLKGGKRGLEPLCEAPGGAVPATVPDPFFLQDAIDPELEEELRSSTPVTPALLSRALQRELKNALAESGMSQRALAQRLDISPAVITRILQHPEKSKLETLLKIAAAMDKNLGDILLCTTMS